jgi:hypothetical protein
LEQTFDATLPAHTDYIDGHRYVQAWDLGRQSDFTVGMTFDVTRSPYPLVDYQRLNKVPWEKIYDLIRETSKAYHVEQPTIDASGPGGDVIEEELTKRGVFVDAFKMNSIARKTNLVNTLQSAMDYGRQTIGMTQQVDEAGLIHEVPLMEPVGGDWGLIRMPAIPQLLDEFGTYEMKDKDLVQDSVMAAGMAISTIYDGGVLQAPVMGIWSSAEEEIEHCEVCGLIPMLDTLVVVRNPENLRQEAYCIEHYTEKFGIAKV